MIVRADLELRSCKKVHSVACKVLPRTRTAQHWKVHFQPALLKPKPYPEGLAKLALQLKNVHNRWAFHTLLCKNFLVCTL